MTLTEIMGKIMVNLDEVTSSNLVGNVAEYQDKIFPLVDTIQTEIATLIKPIKKYSDILSVDKKIAVPSDCFEFLKLYNSDKEVVRNMIFNGNIILTDSDAVDSTYTLYYHKYPATITSSTPLNTELEIDKDCQEALVYGVCAGLTINDEPELFDTYSSRYNTLLTNIQQRMQNNSTVRLVGGLRI